MKFNPFNSQITIFGGAKEYPNAILLNDLIIVP